MNQDQHARMASDMGFVAALDQSGGSTPGALANYGIDASAFDSEEEMFDLVHAMRSRIVTSSSFDQRILAAILFEMTMEREIEGVPSARYLWEQKQVVPFLKVDKGLADEVDGARVMKPNPGLGDMLDRANECGVFGTKMRSVILQADQAGVRSVADQQFDVALEILGAGLMPIIEPEVDIHCPDKADAERLLHERLHDQLTRVPDGQQVMFKLTLPDTDNLYRDLIDDARVLRVVALSGGYSRDDANARLARNSGMIASFSRALVEGLSVDQSAEEFDAMLDESIGAIYDASAA